MKVGDLVRHCTEHSRGLLEDAPVGLVVDIIQKKVWRTNLMGKRIEWGKVKPEPHAVVLYSHNNGTINIPVADLEVAE